MRFSFTEAQEEFRTEVREFLRSEIEAGTFSAQSGDLIRPGSLPTRPPGCSARAFLP
jgi:hypothetical protein